MGMYVQIRTVSPAEMQQLLADPDQVEKMIGGGGRSNSSLSLEKAWHGLHYLLTGSAWEGQMPLGFLIQGGEAIGADLGYGPARLLRPQEVQQVNAALAQVSDDQLWSRFDPARMQEEEIYPGIWDEPPSDLREEYVGYFQELKQLLGQASAGGMGLLVMLS